MESAIAAASVEKVDKAYDSPPLWYDLRGFLILTFAYRGSLLSQLRFFSRNMSGNHLEVAVGTGTLLDLVLRWRTWKRQPASNVVGFDYAERMLAGARKRFEGRSGVNLLRADAARLDFTDNAFDSANIANALHCFPDVDAALKELHRVLKPGGRIAMNVLLYPRGSAIARGIAQRICDWGMRKGILETPYERTDIETRIREAGFEALEARESGNELMLVARKPLPPARSCADDSPANNCHIPNHDISNHGSATEVPPLFKGGPGGVAEADRLPAKETPPNPPLKRGGGRKRMPEPTDKANCPSPTVTENQVSSTAFNYEEAFIKNIGWVTEDEQQRLRGKRIAIGGMGGTGGIHLQTLARLGVGAFHIADFDTFDLSNFNRQAGATVSTLKRGKVDVMAERALDINPELDLRLFRSGVTPENVDEFLLGTDLYVDAVDFYAFEARALIHRRCAELGIPAIIAAPVGMGSAWINFVPGGMTFERYFGLDGLPDDEKALRFLIGLSPAMLQRTYLADPSRVKLAARSVPSTIMGCQLCGAVTATEALKMLLNRGKVRAAPHVLHFDAYRNRFVTTWRPGGYRNPLQVLTTGFIRRRLARMAAHEQPVAEGVS